MFTRKKTIIICFVTIVHLIIALSLLPYIINEYESKTRAYDNFNTSTITSSVIGITQRKNDYTDGIMGYCCCGSGVIIGRISNRYYALTAAHVINDPATEYRALTCIADYEQSPESNSHGEKTGLNKVINELPIITIEYVSSNSDLAIVSFKSTDELSIIVCGASLDSKGFKIVCLSRLNNKIMETYGTITSGQKTIVMMDYRTNTRVTDLVYEHNAYLVPGSSGGPVLSQELELIGINNGGAFSLSGHFINGYFIPYDQIINCILEWQMLDARTHSYISFGKS